MSAPTFRIGDKLTALCGFTLADGRRIGSLEECRVVYPCHDGCYVVETADGGLARIFPDDIAYGTRSRRASDVSGLRVVFFGNGPFALPTLQSLYVGGYDVAAVVTMPDKPSGRGCSDRPSAVKQWAASAGIPVCQPGDLRDPGFIADIGGLRTDVGVVADFRKLPRSVFSLPRLGTLNLHSSLLPMYRGCSTIASALRDGRDETGVTVFRLADDIDTGDIVNNLAVRIGPDGDAGSVFDALRYAGMELVDDAIRLVSAGAECIPQSRVSRHLPPSYAPKLHTPDTYIPWGLDARRVHDLVRSLSPSPGARTMLAMADGTEMSPLKIFRTSLIDEPRGGRPPGHMIVADGRITVACADRLIAVEEMQPPGRRRMAARAFANGWRGVPDGLCRCPGEA